MKTKQFLLPFFFLLSVLAGQARSQNFGTQAIYDEELKKVRQLAPLKDDLFGERLNLQDGTVSFRQTDVSVTSKTGTKMEFGRVSQTRTTLNAFAAGWGMDVPYMVGTYDTRTGWNAAVAGVNRCSSGKFAPSSQYLQLVTETTSLLTQQVTRSVTTSNVLSPAHVFWHGIEINIPSAGNEQLLEKNSNQHLPNDGRDYVGTTKNGWRIRCLPSISNGVGEGFAVLLPNGTTYYFDRIATVKVRDYIEWTNSTGMFSNPRYSYQLPLANYFLLATKVVDRHGNTITYLYDEQYPSRLLSISADDGTRLDFYYDSDNPSSITEIRSGSRRWVYSYLQSEATPEIPVRINLRLQSIIFPDGSSWKFDGSYHFSTFGDPWDLFESWKTTVASFWEYDFAKNCKYNTHNLGQPITPDPQISYTVGMTHPSGARGEFTFKHQFHGINNAPGQCHVTNTPTPENWTSVPGAYTTGVPDVYLAKSLSHKKISGPGLSADLNWSFAYNPSWSFASECQSHPGLCNDRSITSITSPDGEVERIEIGNDYVTNYGRTLTRTIEKNGQIVLQASYAHLASSAGQIFPDNAGNVPLGTGIADMYGNQYFYANRPLARTTLSQDGVTYTTETSLCNNGTYCFDNFARPTVLKRSNTLGWSRTDVTEYHDNLHLWVLGQIKRQYVPDSNPNAVPGQPGSMVIAETEFDALARPWKTYAYGKPQRTFAYNSDGTLSSVTDGLNRTTTLSNWKRGIPQSILHPPTPEAPTGAAELAEVDDNGWITSVTDEIGAKTCYGYDPMGRLAGITYPSETVLGVCDASRWNPTYQEFRPLAAGEWMPPGVTAGQWRQYVATGNYQKVVYFDSLWRPVLSHEYDASNVAPTLRSFRTTYDSSGRVNFQSYPAPDLIPGSSGVRTSYDALDRVTRVEQDSEQGVLATTTEYLTGLQTRVTNPNSQQTVTGFMAWDQPGYDLPLWSSQPEGKVIEITRHPQFGWPLQLKQRSADNSLQQVRSYVYDGYAQLCKTIEPETGATVTGYDAANNPVWSASGLTGGNYASTSDCSYTAASASGRAVTRTYDARNRLKTLLFPDGIGNQVWTYEKDGLPKDITTFNGIGNTLPVVNLYEYYKRRLPTAEFSHQPGWYTWRIGYDYDPIGNLRWQSYPTGLTLDYAPNALGQATQTRDQNNKAYASAALYYPNGAMKQFSYGNGIVHTMTQNARQLPQRVTSSGGVNDFSYNYDNNGNITNIWDLARGDNYSRWMTYDHLDRLTSAGSASFGGDAWHRLTYDALDNIKSWKLAGVKDYADYVYEAQTHRLTNIRNTAGATVVGLDYDPQGNLLNKNGQEYKFDYGNRLRSVTGKETYRYDGHGRRVLNWRPAGIDGPTATVTVSQYSQSGQVMYQEDSTKGASENIYLAGSVIAIRNGGAVKYQHTDALGSPVAVTNEAGAVIERNDYEPYGAVIGKPNYNGIGYTGHVMDGATGLTYMQQRYYDQSLGRFLSIDPVTANSSTGTNFNRYWYANNNPYKFTDPDGRAVESIAGGEIRGADTVVDLRQVVARPARASTTSIVIHRTAGSTAQGAVNAAVRNNGAASFHIVVDTDGTTTQISNLDNIANHVGRPTTDVTNQNSIGIEVVGAYDPNSQTWDPLTADQIEATAQALHIIQDAYGVHDLQIFPHENVSRKTAGEGGTVLQAIENRLTQIRINAAIPPPVDQELPGIER